MWKRSVQGFYGEGRRFTAGPERCDDADAGGAEVARRALEDGAVGLALGEVDCVAEADDARDGALGLHPRRGVVRWVCRDVDIGGIGGVLAGNSDGEGHAGEGGDGEELREHRCRVGEVIGAVER